MKTYLGYKYRNFDTLTRIADFLNSNLLQRFCSHVAWQEQQIVFPPGKMFFVMQTISIVPAMQHGRRVKPLYCGWAISTVEDELSQGCALRKILGSPSGTQLCRLGCPKSSLVTHIKKNIIKKLIIVI